MSLIQANHWHTSDQFRHQLTASMRHWLLSKGSLTALLEAKFGPVQLATVEEYQCFASRAQAQALAVPLRTALIVRNIALQANNQPLIWAHSALPVTSLQGANKQIRLQRHKPLGKILFQHKNLQRSAIQICQANNYWCRRSVFSVNGQPIIVAEAFAQELMQ
ncbi:chorismate--pyruvate lyase family protein [Salinibius halmophilus]|uniref:chorismate--pyruvate lyase family protein n=1 Tax=Salinibius halmophilus TaxID=1853216 RepID=UPI0013140B9B|nr:chorismate lyase [Salinibius halmophilus]